MMVIGNQCDALAFVLLHVLPLFNLAVVLMHCKLLAKESLIVWKRDAMRAPV